MKIGILTFHWANNYGAVLQAYGLARTVEKLGHSVKFINYAPNGQRLAWYQGWGFRSGKEMPARTLWRMRFEWFRRRHLTTSAHCYSREELRKFSREFDAVIVGSDQVWNGHIVSPFESTYFLDFVEDPKCQRISYAACFGDEDQPSETLDKAGALLERFHGLSVRNEMSARIVKTLTGQRPKIVLDPTLLHNYAECLKPQKDKKGYIAVYYLARPHLSLGIDIINLLKSRLKLPVVLIGTHAHEPWADRIILSAGPVQWLRILNNASFICTDSFHGTVFATKFKKPFLSWVGYRSGRIQDFLTRCDLKERLLTRPDQTEIGRLTEMDIDYGSVIEKIEPQRICSISFLKRALTG